MEILYPFFMAFGLVFLSELGDKTQLLVLSFSSKLKSASIILGVALGSLLSHGLAITFGGMLGSFENVFIQNVLKVITYISFLIFGFLTLYNKENDDTNSQKTGLLKKISNLSIGYVLIIALSIAIGELGDKTFLASLGLGIQFANCKIYLILGAILGMVVSDGIAIVFGKFLTSKLSSEFMNKLSGIMFLAFGVIGMIGFLSNIC